MCPARQAKIPLIGSIILNMEQKSNRLTRQKYQSACPFSRCALASIRVDADLLVRLYRGDSAMILLEGDTLIGCLSLDERN